MCHYQPASVGQNSAGRALGHSDATVFVDSVIWYQEGMQRHLRWSESNMPVKLYLHWEMVLRSKCHLQDASLQFPNSLSLQAEFSVFHLTGFSIKFHMWRKSEAYDTCVELLCFAFCAFPRDLSFPSHCSHERLVLLGGFPMHSYLVREPLGWIELLEKTLERVVIESESEIAGRVSRQQADRGAGACRLTHTHAKQMGF
jgi:hypothetical protein